MVAEVYYWTDGRYSGYQSAIFLAKFESSIVAASGTSTGLTDERKHHESQGYLRLVLALFCSPSDVPRFMVVPEFLSGQNQISGNRLPTLAISSFQMGYGLGP